MAFDNDKSGSNYDGARPWQGDTPADRCCDWPECEGSGEHRAPRSRENLRDYYWFCLDHVRQYNSSWNYFDGMETDEYDAMTWSTAKWDRPTWPIGSGNGHAKGTRNGMNAAQQAAHIREAANAFREAPDLEEVSLADFTEQVGEQRLNPEDRRALDVLGLKSTATLHDVKKRYKQLVKRFHPDAQGTISKPQSPKSDDKLRSVIDAYTHLVKSSHLTNST